MMQYRRYGKGGPRVSVLGLGAMRLPGLGWDAKAKYDLTRASALIRRGLRGGVNFIDSHHEYHGGFSEAVVGKALAGWKGHRVHIQTKTPFYYDKPIDYFKKLLAEALTKLGVDCIDYFLFHSMDMKMFKNRGRAFFRLTDWAMKRGMIRRRGFSSHDTPENVKAFIDTGEFSAMLLSYNWLNPTMADTIRYGAAKGLGVSIMNPVGGGSLAANTKQILRLLPGARTAPEVALRFVLGTPGVDVALSGMSSLTQVDRNVRTAGRKKPTTARQRKEMLRRMGAIKKEFMAVCTSCGYCMPCPHGVDIPGNFMLWNQARHLGLVRQGRRGFRRLRRRKGGNASALACKQCGKCLPKCPSHIRIIEQLAATARLLSRE